MPGRSGLIHRRRPPSCPLGVESHHDIDLGIPGLDPLQLGIKQFPGRQRTIVQQGHQFKGRAIGQIAAAVFPDIALVAGIWIGHMVS